MLTMLRLQYGAEKTLKMLMILISVLQGSPTKIAKASDKVRKGAGEKVTPEDADQAVSYIMDKLKEKHVI